MPEPYWTGSVELFDAWRRAGMDVSRFAGLFQNNVPMPERDVVNWYADLDRCMKNLQALMDRTDVFIRESETPF